MTIEKAFQRLSWRFSSGQFTPNQNDVDALKFLAEWVNREKESELQQHSIFAKMYVYSFIHELAFYKDLEFAQKKLHEILNQPLRDRYDEFTQRLNALENEKYQKSIGIKQTHPALISDDDRAKEMEIIRQNQQDVAKYLIGIWSAEKVDQSLNNQITEAINRYKNLP